MYTHTHISRRLSPAAAVLLVLPLSLFVFSLPSTHSFPLDQLLGTRSLSDATAVRSVSDVISTRSLPEADAIGLPTKSLCPFLLVNATALLPELEGLLPAEKQAKAHALTATVVSAEIAGVVAEVKIKQTYKNNFAIPLEAVYVFPASIHAAVHAMQMRLSDGTVVAATVMTRDMAREVYEEAKRQGNTASLLEQDRPNILVMSVANIPPGESLDIEMFYTEMLVPTDASYRFLFPNVVGPRFTGEGGSPLTDPGVDQTSQPWSISVAVHTGMKLQSIGSPTHPVTVRLNGDSTNATCVASSATAFAPDADFALDYTLSGSTVLSGFLSYASAADHPSELSPFVVSTRTPETSFTYPSLTYLPAGRGDNFFLAMIQPPKVTTAADIPPREFLFIMDVSGSMRGTPLETSKTVMQTILSSGMREGFDTFNVLQFAGGAGTLSPEPLPATSSNIEVAMQYIESPAGGGGTRMLNALELAVKLPRTPGTARTSLILTDGFVSVEPQVFQLIRSNLNVSSFWAMSIGANPNRYLTEGVARVGQGFEFWVPNAAAAPKAVEAFAKAVASPLLVNLKVTAEGGFTPIEMVPESLPDLLASRPVVIVGKYVGPLSGSIRLRGTAAGNVPWETTIDVSAGASATGATTVTALPKLWASAKLAELRYTLPTAAAKEPIETIGLRYSLLTEQTSFVAVAVRPAQNLNSTRAVNTTNDATDPAGETGGLERDGMNTAGIAKATAAGGLGYKSAAPTVSLPFLLQACLVAMATLFAAAV